MERLNPPQSATPSILIPHASAPTATPSRPRLRLVGGAPEIVHINQFPLRRAIPGRLPGAAAARRLLYGDAPAGARLALDLQVYFHDQLHAFVDSGKPVLGICNGFQTLVKAGITRRRGQRRRGRRGRGDRGRS